MERVGPVSNVGGSFAASLQVRTVWTTAGETNGGCKSSMKVELKDSHSTEPAGHHSWGTVEVEVALFAFVYTLPSNPRNSLRENKFIVTLVLKISKSKAN